jgi:hypothetical protein
MVFKKTPNLENAIRKDHQNNQIKAIAAVHKKIEQAYCFQFRRKCQHYLTIVNIAHALLTDSETPAKNA